MKLSDSDMKELDLTAPTLSPKMPVAADTMMPVAADTMTTAVKMLMQHL